MGTILKWLLRIAVLMLILTGAGMALGSYLVTRSLPDYGLSASGEGLDAPVSITRDAHAVPHIRAETDADAWFALGFVHAQDRLWQMELSRRAAQGRLSTLLGARTVSVDRLVKTLDIYRYATAAVDAQTPETRAALNAYADGVNAWIRQVNTGALGRGAPEFFLFGDALAPWVPADSIGILKMMALRLSGAARREVLRARALLRLAPQRVADILPDYPVPATMTAPRSAALDVPLRLAERATTAGADADAEPWMTLFGPPPPKFAGASNAWAVDGSRSSSGKALMANDPHLWLSAPSVWYLADLAGKEIKAIGGTLPGVPSVLIGHNGTLGWGLTTAYVDDQDLFIEEVNPANPNQYRLPDGTWTDFATRPIRIEVRGGEPIVETVRTSRHGPILTGSQFDADAITPDGYVAALAWTALTEEDRSLGATHTLMRAQTIEDAMDAAADVVAPAQNVTIADAEGVGMIVAGAIPRRSSRSLSQGRIPSFGTRAENDWTGIRSPSRNPRILRPPSGAVANANNRTTDAPFPSHISFDWARPYRMERLQKELSVREFHSRDGFVALQNDVVSEMARSMLPLIARDLWWREGTPLVQDPIRREALELLAGWNGAMDLHAPEPLIFSEWMRALTQRLAADELGALFEDWQGMRPLFVERVYRNIDGASVWCDIDKTPEIESCPQIASLALDDALARLVRDHGSAIDGWRWGEEHVAVHRHTPLGYLDPISVFFNIEHETSGGDFTLQRGLTEGRGETPFRNVHAAGLRVVFDFADLDRSLMIIATGQSGHPFSRHYDDFADLWVRGDMIPMTTDDDTVRTGAIGMTTLLPEDER